MLINRSQENYRYVNTQRKIEHFFWISLKSSERIPIGFQLKFALYGHTEAIFADEKQQKLKKFKTILENVDFLCLMLIKNIDFCKLSWFTKCIFS